MALELWIPESAKPEPKARCFLCGARFPQSQRQQWKRHVVACSKKNREVIEEMEEDRQNDPLRSIGDKEAFAWLRRRAGYGS